MAPQNVPKHNLYITQTRAPKLKHPARWRPAAHACQPLLRRQRRSLGSQDVAAEGGEGDRLVLREQLIRGAPRARRNEVSAALNRQARST